MRGRPVEQLMELRRRAAEYASRDGRVAERGIFLRGARMRAWRSTPSVITRACSRSRVLVEPARHPHGRDARGARSLSSSRGGHSRRSRVGAQLASWRCARDPRWGVRGEINVGQLVSERYPMYPCRLASRRMQEPSRRRPLGTRQPSASACAMRCGERGGCAAPGRVSRNSCCARRSGAVRLHHAGCWSARSASSICADRASEATTFHARVADQCRLAADSHRSHDGPVEPLERTRRGRRGAARDVSSAV